MIQSWGIVEEEDCIPCVDKYLLKVSKIILVQLSTKLSKLWLFFNPLSLTFGLICRCTAWVNEFMLLIIKKNGIILDSNK